MSGCYSCKQKKFREKIIKDNSKTDDTSPSGSRQVKIFPENININEYKLNTIKYKSAQFIYIRS